MNPTTSFFNFGPTDNRPPVKIRTRRAMILPQLDGKPGHAPAGTQITVTADILDQLETGDFEFLGRCPGGLDFAI